MMENDRLARRQREQQRTLQPIARLKTTSGVSGLCFLYNNNNNKNNKLPKRNKSKRTSNVNKVEADADETKERSSSSDDDDDDSSSSSDDDDEEVQFQCRSIIHKSNNNHKHNIGMDNSNALLVDQNLVLVGGLDSTAATFLLATCHNNGPAALLWDLRHQKVVLEFGGNNRSGHPAPGLALRRLSSSSSSLSAAAAVTDDESSISGRVLYQTRDAKGTVTLHDLTGCDRASADKSAAAAALVTMETYSQTFCAASPCVGDENLVALPSHDAAYATIRDWRMAPTDRPVAYIHGAGGGGTMDNNDATITKKKHHGMLTSLAMLSGGQETGHDLSSSSNDQGESTSTPSSSSSSRPILACGMEDGNIFFHDLAMTGSSSSTIPRPAQATSYHLATSRVISLSPSCSRSTTPATGSGTRRADPILTLDLAQSAPSSSSRSSSSSSTHHHGYNCCTTSFVAVAGLAGHAADLGDVPAEEQGRIAIIKGSSSSSLLSSPQHDDSRKISLRLRARVGPNYYQNNTGSNVDTQHSATGPGFAGISVCRWRPDGRIFAAGGWDKRVRIYDRAASNNSSSGSTSKTQRMLAVLKGHEASVTAVDWAPDAKSSGLLATGATDGSVCIWSCFGVDK